MNELFDLAPSLSPRLKWMREHDIQVEFIPEEERRGHEAAWEVYSYWDDAADDEDPTAHTGYGETEDEAIVDFARRNHLKLWNEPSHPPKD